MRKNEIEKIAIKGIQEILDNTFTIEKINKLNKKHSQKIHFIPKNYRILNGLLQSLNIQFGDFIEVFSSLLLQSQNGIKIHDLSGKKIKVQISEDEENLISRYIEDKQQNTKELNLKDILNKKIEPIDVKNKTKKIDIDLFFSFKNKNYLFEIKYADDHDSGKIENIPRKLLRTYFSLKRETGLDNIIPAVFYFDNKERYKDKFLKENANCFRGRNFWNKFCSDIDYQDILDVFEDISENKVIIKQFDKINNQVTNVKTLNNEIINNEIINFTNRKSNNRRGINKEFK